MTEAHGAESKVRAEARARAEQMQAAKRSVAAANIDVDACRWGEGEILANAELRRSQTVCAEGIDPLDPVGSLMLSWPVEIVGLGFNIVGADGERSLVWEQLPNTADVDSKQFKVEGEALHACMAAVRSRYPEATHISGAILWHSHYTRVLPSKIDIRQFPKWLATVGIVYHSPTGQSSAYDHSGFISSTTESALLSYTTGDTD